MTIIARKNAGTAIAGTDMNEMTPWNMTNEETVGVKGTIIYGGIRREGFSAEKSVGRQREITTQYQHRRIEKQKTIAR